MSRVTCGFFHYFEKIYVKIGILQTEILDLGSRYLLGIIAYHDSTYSIPYCKRVMLYLSQKITKTTCTP